MVGLIPLFAVDTIEPEVHRQIAGIPAPHGVVHQASAGPVRQHRFAHRGEGVESRRLLQSDGAPSRLRRVLQRMLDENEFLSPHGIRAHFEISQGSSIRSARGRHRNTAWITNRPNRTTGLFGGNSNWRGPVWFPVNYLLIESLQRFHHYFGDEFQVEFPTGSGDRMNLGDVAAELSRRLSRIFLAR